MDEIKIHKSKINEKKNELNKLIEKNLPNLLTDEILEVSQVLDKFISNYFFSSKLMKN
ncbi:hypothetical protein SH2C18_51730 [Clostridium sediminicola]|uniref:aspartyl-phosphate phosphatase Spo0E family protein n=1 Tax=Clostridium sediminicola TaxID=3114879 RepID=UPI0031F211FD